MAGPLAGASSARESLAPPALDTSASGAWRPGTSFTFNVPPTKPHGIIAGTNATLGPVRAGTGSSMAIEYRTATAALTNQTAAFGTKTTFWGITTDALTAG